MSDTAQLVLLLSAVVTALGVLWQKLHVGQLLRAVLLLVKLADQQRSFLSDWSGEPPRPDDGYEGRPSFPARIAMVERRTADLAHTFRGEVTSRLTLLAEQLAGLVGQSTESAHRLEQLDARVTDHRRRNEQQVRQLERAVESLRDAAHAQALQLDEIRSRSHRVRASDPPPSTGA